MTLIVTVAGRESIWMLADRRLSGVKEMKNDARKIMFLQTKDGVAILGYAGLGAVIRGKELTEPSDWMSRALRGRNLLMEESVNELARAASEQLPQYLSKMPIGYLRAHHISIISFVNEKMARYSINLTPAPNRKDYYFSVENHGAKMPTTSNTVGPFSLAGSGGLFLKNNMSMLQNLPPLIRDHDNKRLPAVKVAEHFANLNHEVHRGYERHLDGENKSVGPNCIVAWRFRRGGGEHRCYTGTMRDRGDSSCAVPSIALGWNLAAIGDIFASKMSGKSTASEITSVIESGEIEEEMNRLSTKPDEKL